MKKHSLFKALLIIFALLIIVSYVVPDRNGTISYLGLGTIFLNSVQSFYYFFDTAIFLFVLGGFYGVLNKTGAYKKLIDNIASKVKPNSKKFIYAVIAIFALVASLTGFTLHLFIFVPFVIAIILLLGYDKLVAISSTIGAIIVGYIGGIFVTFRDPNSYYTAFTTYEAFVDIEKFSNLFPKLLLLFGGIALLIYFVNNHIKNVEEKKVKYELNGDSDVVISEVKGNYKDIKTWPLVIVLSLVLILLILGYMPWNSLFGLEIFNDLHATITTFKIGDFAVFNNIISSISYAFGEWAQLGNYMAIIIVLLVATLIIKFIYRIKFDDMLDEFVSGMKKFLPVAVTATLAYAVLVCAYNNGFIETLINNAVDAMGSMNVFLSSVFTMLGSLLYSDIYYTAHGVFTPILSTISDEALYQVIALNFQTLSGLTMLVGPTSIMLIVGLKYLDIPYTTWLKYIWRFLLMLFILIFVVLMIIALI